MLEIRKVTTSVAVTSAVLLAHFNAAATEGGVSIDPPGVESTARSALPPPGIYGIGYYRNYQADSAKDNRGNTVTGPDFKVGVNALVNRFVWVTPVKVAGGDLALQAVLPIARVSVDIAPGLSQTRTGLGDTTLGAGIGWHFSEKLHALGALDLDMPTGRYDKNALANVGTNHWAISPKLGFSYVQKEGINWDLRNTLVFNSRNKDTGYRSGIEWFADYTLGWGFGNGLVAGVGGYVYQQLSNDKQNGQSIDGSKGRAMAFGPSVRYTTSNGLMLSAKFEREFNVRNRAEGKSFWVRAVYAF